MKPTYPLQPAMVLICETQDPETLQALADVIQEEQARYSPAAFELLKGMLEEKNVAGRVKEVSYFMRENLW